MCGGRLVEVISMVRMPIGGLYVMPWCSIGLWKLGWSFDAAVESFPILEKLGLGAWHAISPLPFRQVREMCPPTAQFHYGSIMVTRPIEGSGISPLVRLRPPVKCVVLLHQRRLAEMFLRGAAKGHFGSR